MKRLLSILLVLSMAVGLLAGITLTASAETVIEKLEITGVTAPAAGNAPTTEGITFAPSEGITYAAEWQVYDYERGWYGAMEEGEKFASGNVYRLVMEFDLGENSGDDEGIRYDSTLNGESLAPYGAFYDEYQNLVYVTKEYKVDVQMIDTIVIENMPEIQAGASTAASQIVLPEDANYYVSGIDWTEVNHETGSDDRYVGETLEDGKRYKMALYLKPAAGYWFDYNPEVQANAAVDWVSAEGDYADLYFVYDLRPVVSQVEITGVPEAVYGEGISTEGIQIPEGANYTLDAYWQYWTNEMGWTDVESGTFGYGEYRLCMNVLPAEGYTVAEYDVIITVDGTPIEELNYGWDCDADRIYIETTMMIEPENGYIDYVGVVGAPEDITAGADITVPTLTVEEGKATITDTKWVDAEHEAVTGKFEDGEAYYLAITMKPSEEGYAFENWFHIDVADHPYETERKPDGSVVVYVRYSLRPTIDAVNVTVTVPAIGAAPAEPVVEGDKAVIIDYQWREQNNWDEVTQFEDGKRYYLSIGLEAVEGCDFDGNVKLTLNGQEPDEWSHGDTTAYIGYYFTFQDIIERIDVTMPEPALGQTPDYEDIQVTGEGYAIDYAYWHSNTTYEEVAGAFGKDKYTLELTFTTEAGYEFVRDCPVYINGVQVENSWANNSYADANVSYSFRDVISKIELPAFPEIEVGDEIESVELEAPEGAKYQLGGYWLVVGAEGSIDLAEGVFENGKAYYLMLDASPVAGYEFAEDAVITVGGKEYTSSLMNVDTDYASVAKLYSFGVKVIETIELTVPTPEDGKTHGQITVPEDGGYIIYEDMWGVSETDDMDDVETLEEDDTFAYGNYYWIGAVVMAEEGYVFAEDVKVTVNGKEIELDPEYSYVIANAGQIVCGLGKLEEPSKPTNPDTDDMMPVAALAALVVLSAAGMAVTVASKKRYF